MISVEFVGGPLCGETHKRDYLPDVIEQVYTACGFTMTARYVRDGGYLPSRMPGARRYRFAHDPC